ncbi:FAS1-like dehydratase domain-containing protein [Streptomyces sp. B21-083]|uniref:FAS1-like dehydratase domain-containing protein n=1 Tax=Streptomyces sp. B21-083 TaxID=3039410 RepID=UPI002FF31CA8
MRPTPPPLHTYVESWTPGPVRDEDVLGVGPAAALSAVLNLPGPAPKAGEALAPMWQWLFFLSWPAGRLLGADGHPLDGHFLPPLPHRQRMWAGGRCEITQPLCLGEPVERVSSLASVTAKRGRTGEMLFVTERREFRRRADVSRGGAGHRLPVRGAADNTRPPSASSPGRTWTSRGSSPCTPTRRCSSASAR